MKKHQVRIVGGEYRRTPIPVIEAAHLRPTPDRIRETLFNWLFHFWGGQFDDKRVLDLFAGSGALGFEAASRGVAHVTLVEQNPAALRALRTLQDRLAATHTRIHAGDALQFAARHTGPRYDLLLLDPPFHQGWFERLWPCVRGLVQPGGLVYLESEPGSAEPPEPLRVLRETRAGQVQVRLLQFAAMQKTMNNQEISPLSADNGTLTPNNDTETA